MKVQPSTKHYWVAAVDNGAEVSHTVYNVHNQQVATGLTYDAAHKLADIMEKAREHMLTHTERSEHLINKEH